MRVPPMLLLMVLDLGMQVLVVLDHTRSTVDVVETEEPPPLTRSNHEKPFSKYLDQNRRKPWEAGWRMRNFSV
jgi:hypothetical protein